jgi:transcriptional regulator of arginine metabolism
MNKSTDSAAGGSKIDRQALIRKMVAEDRIDTQSTLVDRLHAEGVACTQASISRDIREIGLIKRGGRYVEPRAATSVPDLADYAESIAGFMNSVTAVGDHLVVIKTLPGTAHSVGLYVDGIGWPGVVGTVAGDDTLFVAVVDRGAGRQMISAVEEIMDPSS